MIPNMELVKLGMFLFITRVEWQFMHERQRLSFIANNDKQKSQLRQMETLNVEKQRKRDGDIFARCAGVAQHVHNPHSFIWHSTPSQSLRLTVVPRRETTWLTKQLNIWLNISCFVPLLCLHTKGQESVMKRNTLARFSKTSDSPECHANLTKFQCIKAWAVRLLFLDLSWWHKLTHAVETANVGEYVYVNSSLF